MRRKGQKRPADVVSNVVQVMRGLAGDDAPDTGKSKAAQELGGAGGKERAANMSPD